MPSEVAEQPVDRQVEVLGIRHGLDAAQEERAVGDEDGGGPQPRGGSLPLS